MHRIGAALREIKKELKPVPEDDAMSDAERTAALEFYRDRRIVEKYLKSVGVRRRLREESHEIDTALVPPECLVWLENRSRGAAMILCGPPGVGKSTAAVWCLRRVYLESALVVKPGEPTIGWSAPSAYYVKAGDLYDAVFERNEQTIKRAESVEVLIIDDWGQPYEHAWPLSRMDRLIDYRWDELLPTIVTTNMLPFEDPESLKATMPRAYDRLNGEPGPGVVEIDRPSLRRRR